MSRKLLDAAAVTVMCCSLVATGVYVRRNAFQPAPALATAVPARYVSNAAVASGRLRIGPSNARVTIVEFTDYECPACRAFHPTLRAIQERVPEVAIEFRDFPLMGIHPNALAAALAVECAARQGRLPQTQDVLFSAHDSLGKRPWDAYAAAAGVPDLAAFGTCLRDQAVADLVEQDVEAGNRLRLNGTPSWILNDSLYVGGRPLAELEKMVRNALGAPR